MAKRITKSSINWVDLEKRVPADQKVNFFAFKGKSDSYLRRMQANPPEPPKIDWEYYKKMVPVAGVVDKLKAEFEKFSVPVPQDTYSKAVDDQWSALQPEIKKYCDERQKDIDESTKELNRIKSLPSFDEMTMEMVYDMYPGLALDPVNRPSFWPHTIEEQPEYRTPDQKGMKHLDVFKP